MAVAPAAVNSLQWVVVQVAMLEKLLEWFLAKPIDYVQEAAAVALKHAKVPRVFLVACAIQEQVHIQ